jgi:hypothetical protein
MRFRGFNLTEQPLPGDIVLRGCQLMRYTLDAGWQVHDGFRGDFVEGERYEAGDVVIRYGAMWIATTDADVWRCIVSAPTGGTDR